MYPSSMLLLLTQILQVMSVEYPAFYALDIEDGQGSMLLSSWGTNCPFYRSKDSVISDRILYLYHTENMWFISNSGSYQKPYDRCPTVIENSKPLFTQINPSTLPTSDGWYNVTKAEMIGAHNETVTLNLRKVEACRIYTNAFFKIQIQIEFENVENFDQCQKKAYEKGQQTFFKYTGDYFIISSRKDGNKTACVLAMKNEPQWSICPTM